MTWMHGVGRDHFEKLLERLEKSGSQTLVLDGAESGDVVVEGRRSDEGLSADFIPGDGDAVSVRVFEETPRRPEGYPTDMPFVANVKTLICSVGQHEDRKLRTVLWLAASSEFEMMDAVVAECVTMGWDVKSQGEWTMRLGCGGRERTVSRLPTLAAGIVTVLVARD